MAATVGDFLLQRLSAWGVRRVFVYPVDGINGIMGAFGRAVDELVHDTLIPVVQKCNAFDMGARWSDMVHAMQSRRAGHLLDGNRRRG